MFPVNNHTGNTLGYVGYTVSVATVQLCKKAVTDSTLINESECTNKTWFTLTCSETADLSKLCFDGPYF